MLAGVLSSFILALLSGLYTPLYGGQPVGEGIIEPEVLKVPLNVLFCFMFFIQSTVMVFLLKK